MKTMGLIGGTSWESTAIYYEQLNLAVKARLGGLHSAKIVLASFDFAKIAALQHEGNWDEIARIVAEVAHRLESAGADVLAICANTMHKGVEEAQALVSTPVLHSGEVTRKAVLAQRVGRVVLLGTRYMMEGNFIRDRLSGASVKSGTLYSWQSNFAHLPTTNVPHWNAWLTRARLRQDRSNALKSSCTPPKGRRSPRLLRSCVCIRKPCATGSNASTKTVSPVLTTCPAPANRRPIPQRNAPK